MSLTTNCAGVTHVWVKCEVCQCGKRRWHHWDTTPTSAEELISESIRYHSIAHAAYTPELADHLMALSRNSAETDGVARYWGRNYIGDAWSVYLHSRVVWCGDRGHLQQKLEAIRAGAYDAKP